MKKLTTILTIAGLLGFTNVYAQEDCQVLLPEIAGTYKGDCKKGKAEGQGTAKGTDEYTGQFKAGYPDGKGIYTWKNGDVFDGIWLKGKREGEGRMTIKREGKTDSVVTGFWKKDKYAGAFSRPFIIHNRTNHIVRLDVRKVKGASNSIQIELSSTSSGIPRLDGGGVSPKPEITEILVAEGIYGQIQHVSSTAKGSIKKLIEVRFPFRAKIRMGTQEVDLEFREAGSWNTIIGLNE
jgi:hypothetical protein